MPFTYIQRSSIASHFFLFAFIIRLLLLKRKEKKETQTNPTDSCGGQCAHALNVSTQQPQNNNKMNCIALFVRIMWRTDAGAATVTTLFNTHTHIMASNLRQSRRRPSNSIRRTWQWIWCVPVLFCRFSNASRARLEFRMAHFVDTRLSTCTVLGLGEMHAINGGGQWL